MKGIKIIFLLFIFSIQLFAQSEDSNQEIIADSFEAGFGNWNDGGSDCTISRSHPTSGIYSIKLKDNSDVSSSVFSDRLQLEGTSEISISFKYHAYSMEKNEDFLLEISTDGGQHFDIIENWVSGLDFENQEYHSERLNIEYDFTDDTVLRFRCDASSNNDHIYLDQIEIHEGANHAQSKIIILDNKPVFNLSPVIDKSKVESIKLYPNPASDYVSINLKAVQGHKGSIEIYNLVGSKLSRTIFKEDHPETLNFPIDYLENGYYSVCVRTDNDKLHVMRLMVSK